MLKAVMVPVRLDPEIEHVVVVGQSRSGKTFLTGRLIDGVSKTSSVAWFCPEGDEHYLARALGMKMLIFRCHPRVNNFSYNPLALTSLVESGKAGVAEVDEEEADDLTNAISSTTEHELSAASYSFLRPIMERVLRQRAEGRNVGLQDLAREIEAQPSSPMKKSLVARTRSLCGTECLLGRGPFPIHRFVTTSGLFLIDGLSRWSQIFLVSSIISKILHYCRLLKSTSGLGRAPGDGGPSGFGAATGAVLPFRVTVAIDEANRLFAGGGGKRADAQSPLIDLLNRGLKNSVSAIICAPYAAELPAEVLLQSSLIFAGRTTDQRSLSALGLCMDLEGHDRARAPARLAKQEFLYRRRDGSGVIPIRVADVEVDRKTPFDITRHNALLIADRPELAELFGREWVKTSEGASVACDAVEVPESGPSVEKTRADLSSGSRAQDALVVKTIGDHPFNTTSEIFLALRGRLSQEDVNFSRKRLLASGAVLSCRIRTGAQGSCISLRLSEEGLAAYGVQPPSPCGRGSFEHQWLCFHVGKAWREQGRRVEFEFQLGADAEGRGGRLADVWSEMDGACWIAQIGLHNQLAKEAESAVDLLAVPEVDRLFVVCSDRGHMQALEEKLQKMLAGKDGVGSRLTFHLAKEFVRGAGK